MILLVTVISVPNAQYLHMQQDWTYIRLHVCVCVCIGNESEQMDDLTFTDTGFLVNNDYYAKNYVWLP